MPKGVVFLPSYYEAIENLPDDERLCVYDAVIRYGLYGEIIEMSPIAKSLFTLIKPVIDSSQNRYCASTENGKKGGRPKKNQTENQTENQDYDMDYDYEKDFDLKKDDDLEGEVDSERGSRGKTLKRPCFTLDPNEFERKRAENNAKLEHEVMLKNGLRLSDQIPF